MLGKTEKLFSRSLYIVARGRAFDVTLDASDAPRCSVVNEAKSSEIMLHLIAFFTVRPKPDIWQV